MASRNSHCAARGRGKRPAENPKNPKMHVFEDFLGHFFLINYIGFSLKYVKPKSSTDFFHRKNRTFPEIFHFSFFSYISSPTSESFIAPLLLQPTLIQIPKKRINFSEKNTIADESGDELSGDSLK